MATGARAVSLTLAVATCLAASVAACSGDDAADKGPVATTAAVGGTQGRPQDGLPLPKSQQLDLEQRHANGVVVRLTEIRFGPSSMTVALEAFNGFRDEVELNRLDTALVDDQNQEYRFSPPTDNPELRIRPNETLRGELAFVGTPPREARSLRLVLNGIIARTEKRTDNFELSPAPRFVFEGIPVGR